MGNEYWQVYDPTYSTIDRQSTVIAMPDDIHQYPTNVEVNPDMIGINHTNVSVIKKLLTQEMPFNTLKKTVSCTEPFFNT
jgi:hypothetical protein